MDFFQIEGGKKLSGNIFPQGSKNEALPVIAAVLLTSGKVIIKNIPDIKDIVRQIELLKILGVDVKKTGSHEYEFCAADIKAEALLSDEFVSLSRNIRGSVLLIGPLVARLKEMYLYKPGGDKIGRRRLDTHFLGLQKLGADFEFDLNKSFFKIKATDLKGTYIHLDEPSVTGTANIIMAATMARGKTTIYNAACEPHVQQLCHMLNSMGANISNIGTNRIEIEGVTELKGCTHTCKPDIIEIGSFIGMAAMTGSEITIKNACCDSLGLVPFTFNRLGIELKFVNDDIVVPAHSLYEIENQVDGSISTIYDAPWPGFPSDLISIALVVATMAKGNILIHQKMFESRLFFVDSLIDMGAQIILCDPHRATVLGTSKQYRFRAIKMRSPDIRAGVALLLAALCADGFSTIYNIEQIDRGYENIDLRLNSLGAGISRLQDQNA
jgi:UDP-N-acetylglucosamine 1-carboxyvinyltransferase